VTPTVPHQALYRRWRAQTFSQIVGQEAVVETLRNAVRTERVAHALLFVGPRGTGKTSLARIMAKAVNCTNLQDGDACDACEACVAIRDGTTLDVLEIDAASNRGISEVRELRDRLAYPPGFLRRKVYILDEAHQITRDAWNALLKSLEEPPDFVIFMFASTEPSGFPPAILSRLQRFDVRRLSVPEIEGKLTRILEADGRAIEPGALTLIARLAAGGMRDAESILDQLLSMTTDVISEPAVRDLLGLADAAAVDGFVEALLTGDAAAGIEILDRLEERGRDPRALLDQVVEAVRARLVTEAGSGGTVRGAALTAVARRLVAIDPDRAGIGGLRLQLELALFAARSNPAEPPTRPVAGPASSEPATSPATSATPRPPFEPVEPADPAAVVEATLNGTAPTPSPAEVGHTTTGPARAAASSSAPGSVEPTTPPIDAPEPAEAGGVDATSDDTPDPEATTAPEALDVTVAPPAAPAADLSATGPVAADLERLVGDWPDIVRAVGPATRAVLTECRPISVEGNVVTLGFPEAKSFLKDHAERKRPELEAAIGGHLGRSVNVRTVATNIEVAPLVGVDDLVAEARRIFADDLADVVEID
jgi:DNA polymerase-3 subunit gamma/tau